MAEGGLPNVDIQKSIITEQLKKPLVKEDIWYILDAKWLMHWKTYVGFDSWDTYNVGVESCNPGPIDNTPLFQEGSTKLKEHLVDDLDYVLIPQEGWEKLVSWYGMIKEQEPLTRKVIEEGVYTKSLKVEIYPWHLKICENSKPDEQVCREFSRADTIAQLEKAVRAEFKIADEKEVRLWSRYMSNINELLSKKEKTLQDAGLYAGQVIVVEQKNDDGTWPRQTTSKRSGNTYGSSSSYNNFSYYEPGRDRVTPGLCGLSNIGNTCFMNSALQCMSNVPKLTEYFLSNKWTEEVNENNPLGMHGEIAHSYAKLVHIMWSGNYSYTVPKNFKYAVGRFAPQFSGYQQQDSQELMAFLLDGLHEDLNRIREKPYVEIKDAENRPDTVVAKEAWDNYKKRNNSIIVDTFHGLLKSTVQCPDCDKISVTFDPFCYLSLPLPVKKERQLEVFWVPLDPNKDTVQYKLTVPKLGCVADLCDALSAYVDVKQDFMMVTDVYNHRFHKIFLKSEALSSIMERDDIFVYEMPISSLEDEDKVVLAIYMREEREKSPYQSHQLFGQPLLLAVPKYNCTYQHLYELVLHRISRIVTVPADNYKWWIKHSEKAKQEAKFTSDSVDANMSSPMHDKGDSAHCDEVKTGLDDSGMEVSNGDTKNGEVSSDSESDRYSVLNSHTNNETSLESEQVPRLFKFSIVNSYGTAELEQKLNDDTQPIKLSSRMYLSMDWKRLAKELFYKESIADAIDSHDTTKTKPQKKQVLQLSDCLELFTTTEKLGENDLWFCPVCKKQQQATKKFDLWSLPDTLIIHLKRFLYNRHWRDKIDTLVEFPAISLDLSKYVIDPSKDHCMYELIAVSNHYGGLGGGHYTAYCKNIEEEAWYNFDDASVSKAHEESTVSKAAYVLVYQRTGTWRSRKKTSQTAATTTKAEPEMNGIDSKTVEYMDTN